MSSQVEISGYDPQWAEEYMREKRKIVEALRDVCVGIEHIGSTSVPDLGAKAIIDIMVGVEELASLQSEHRERLQGIQYEYVHKPDFPERAFFRRGEWGTAFYSNLWGNAGKPRFSHSRRGQGTCGTCYP